MFLSIDLGGSFIKYALFKERDKLIFSKKKRTPNNKEELLNLLSNLISHYDLPFGLALPGPFKKKGFLGDLLNLPIANFNMAKFLSSFNKPFIIENDANAAAFGFLVKKNFSYNNIILLTLGTGIGLGIITDKKIYYGSLNAGEISRAPGFFNNYLEEDISKKIFFEERALFFNSLNKLLLFLNQIFDPDIIVLTGGLINNKSFNKLALKEFFSKNSSLKTKLIFSRNYSLLGLYYLFKENIKRKN